MSIQAAVRETPGNIILDVADEKPYFRVSELESPIRQSWSTLPWWIQGLLTAVSGKPLVGENLRETSAVEQVVTALVAMLGGAALSVWATSSNPWAWPLIPLGWLLTVHGLRKNDLGPFHEAAHGVFSRCKEVNDAVGEILGVIHLAQNFKSYGPSHRVDHHSKSFATKDDPTFDFLLNRLGLRAGMSRNRAWCTLITSLISPVFHARFMVDRIRSSFRGASFVYFVLMIDYLVVLASAIWLFGWVPVLMGWLIPLTVLYNAVTTIRACVEHTFPPSDLRGRGRREVLAGCTHAIHFGSMAPVYKRGLLKRAACWVAWAIRMTVFDWPARLLICPGEAVSHDFHHRHPRWESWPAYVANRQDDIAKGTPGWGIPYSEVWGVHNAIGECFRTLRLADPALFNPKQQ